MQITVTTRHIDNKDKAEGLKEYAKKKARRIERHVRSEKNPSEIKIVLCVEKFRNIAEIMVNSGTFQVTSSIEREDMYLAVDTAIDSIIKQLKKQTDKKIKVKRRVGVKPKEDFLEELVKPAIAEEIENAGVQRVATKPMSVKEAMLQLSLSDKDFLVFRNSETDKLNVVYKRKGGKAGLIVP